MEEKSRYSVGIDMGSNKIRVVIGAQSKDEIFVVGYGEVDSEGVRRGAISDLRSPVNPLVEALHAAENMSGYDIHGATFGINSVSLTSTKVDGMITTMDAQQNGGITDVELDRLEEVAMQGKVPNNRKLLEIVPFEYIVDGQGNIRDPRGMNGGRVELRANAVTALTPDVDNISAVAEQADNLAVHVVMPAVTASAEAIVTNRQRENGVGVVNFGGNTTSIAVYDEGELQFVCVIPMGSNDITRDLATILATTPEMAEEVKIRYADGEFSEGKDVTVKHGQDEYIFARKDINEVVEARLDEIFEAVHKKLHQAGYDKRLPEGLILTGGGAKLRNLDLYVRTKMNMATRIGEIAPFITSSTEEVLCPDFAAAIGLMMRDMEDAQNNNQKRNKKSGRAKKKGSKFDVSKVVSGFFKSFK